MAARDVRTGEVFASFATSMQEVDEALMLPATAGLKMPDGVVLNLEELQVPAVRAKLRFGRRRGSKCVVAQAMPAPALVGVLTPLSTCKSTKDLPAGDWQAQVINYETVKD